MDAAFRFMKDNGYDAVKTGYVGTHHPARRAPLTASGW